MQPFYHFVHRVYARDRDGLFRQMAGWGADLQRFLMHGTGSSPPIDLNALVRDEIRRGYQRRELREDLSKLSTYRLAMKEHRTRKLRERLARGGGADIWDEKDIEAILGEVGLTDADDAQDLILELSEDPVDRELEEAAAYAEIGGALLNGDRSSYGWRGASGNTGRRNAIKNPPVREPELKVVPILLKPFVRQVSDRLVY